MTNQLYKYCNFFSHTFSRAEKKSYVCVCYYDDDDELTNSILSKLIINNNNNDENRQPSNLSLSNWTLAFKSYFKSYCMVVCH